MAKSKQKGNRGEREVVELCKKWWDDDSFKKSPESGGMATVMEQQGYPEDIIGRLAGDLLVPADFPFCIESKLYAEIDIYSIIRNPGNNIIRQWWEQCRDDARKADKHPLLTFREDRKKRYVVIALETIEELDGDIDSIGGGWLECWLGTDFVRILLWDDFVEEYSKKNVLEACNNRK